jgi:hypothetical protein
VNTNTSTVGNNISWTFVMELMWCQPCGAYMPPHTSHARVEQPPIPVQPIIGWLDAHYETLGAEPGATPDELSTAFRKRLKEVHPDVGGDAEETKRVIAAYDALKAAGKAK